MQPILRPYDILCQILVEMCIRDSSIPESIGIVIGTPEGNIVYTGDFKFDQTASESYATDFARLAEIGREGVLALLSDSANADSNIQVASEQEVCLLYTSLIRLIIMKQQTSILRL